MSAVHANEAEVKEILNLSDKLAKRSAFAYLRNKGILKRNKEMKDRSELVRVKMSAFPNPKTDTVHCKICGGSSDRLYFYRHKKTHSTHSRELDHRVAVHSELLSNTNDSFMKILNGFQDNNIGHHCRNDETIKLIGRNLWLKERGKIDKEFQVRKSVMAYMRGLSELFIEFQDCMTSTGKGMVSDAQEIFKKDNWDELQEVIDKVTKKEKKKDGIDLKYGKKNGLYYLLLRSAENLTRALPVCVWGRESKKQYIGLHSSTKVQKNAVFTDAM